MEHLGVCERDIYLKSFENRFRTEFNSPRTGERKNCVNCKFFAETEAFGNFLPSVRHNMNRTKVSQRKNGVKFVEKHTNGRIFDNHSRTVSYVLNLPKSFVEGRK